MAILDLASDRLELLRRTRSVAIVGMSRRTERPSHFVATYLRARTDWTLYYVNPHETEIDGRRVYPTLDHLPEAPDLIDVFRRVDELPDVTTEAIARGVRSVWFQLGLTHDEAALTAVAAGLDVVQNRCLKIEHARFAGGLHTAGFDTGVIDSRRDGLIRVR